MKAFKHPKSYGYHRLETDDEVLKRCGLDSGSIPKGTTIEQWVEKWGFERKMIYVP